MKGRHSDLDLPAALLGPFRGRTPLPLPHHRAQHNPYVWDLFMGMATSIGRRFNIYLLLDWRLALGAGATLAALMIAFDQLTRL